MKIEFSSKDIEKALEFYIKEFLKIEMQPEVRSHYDGTFSAEFDQNFWYTTKKTEKEEN